MENDATQRRVIEGCAAALEPVIRLLLECGVGWKPFVELTKAAFVKVASEEFGIRGRPTNASRVAMLTGLDRREVRRLRSAGAADSASGSPGYMTKPSQVIAGWYQDIDFMADGVPRELPLDGSAKSFTELARRYAPGIPPTALIKELLAAGVVQWTADKRVRAIKRTYIPRRLSDEQIRLWSSILRDVGTTLEHNLTRLPSEAPRFERRAVQLSVDAQSLVAFRRFLELEGQSFLERVDNWLAGHRANPTRTGSTPMRLGAGVYHIQDHLPGRAARRKTSRKRRRSGTRATRRR